MKRIRTSDDDGIYLDVLDEADDFVVDVTANDDLYSKTQNIFIIVMSSKESSKFFLLKILTRKALYPKTIELIFGKFREGKYTET